MVTEIPIGSPTKCSGRGGATVGVKEEPSTNKDICNGEEGPEGSPWTAGGTLPPGATETGTWAFTSPEAAGEVKVPISFPIPLKAGLTETHVHLQGEPGFFTTCAGTFEEPAGTPEAPAVKPGELCVYKAGFQSNVTFGGITDLTSFNGGTNVSGALLHVTPSGDPASGQGAWAVTGCTTEVGAEFQCP